VSWQSIDLAPFQKDVTEDFVQVQRVNGKWFILGSLGTILTSTDAKNWSKSTISGFNLSRISFSGITYTNGTYLAYYSDDNGNNSKNLLTTSITGMQWAPATGVTVGSADLTLHIFANQGMFVQQVGLDKMTTSTDKGKTWQAANLSFYGPSWTTNHRFYFSTCYQDSCVASGGGDLGALIITQSPSLNFSATTKGFFTLSSYEFAWAYASTVLPNGTFCTLINQINDDTGAEFTPSISCLSANNTWSTPIIVSDIPTSTMGPQQFINYVPKVNKYIISGAIGDYTSLDGTNWTQLNSDNVQAIAAITLATP
jgi:roadblock/LC7 domain-containing protein